MSARFDPLADFFTRCCLFFERGQHLATNYARGTLVPINTRVKVLAMGGNEIRIQLVDSGVEVNVVNVPKYTKRATAQLFDDLFSQQPIDLSSFSPEIQSAIQQGIPRLGMTKEQVIMARGYPPRHATPSLEGERWIYWSSRMVKRTLLFRDGVLAQGRGLS